MDGGRGSSPAHLFSKSASEAPSEASAAVGVERARHRQRPSLAPISMGFPLGRAGADGVLFRDVDVDADSLLEHLKAINAAVSSRPRLSRLPTLCAQSASAQQGLT